ncbi:MAG: exodeoxyribonuclease III [Magnetococcales bacterium]|nr:exodeoxyribonuclease III [Magnetococcales bacterium]
MKIATWNVNSLRVRQEQVQTWLQEYPVDLLCLQETKLTDDLFPEAAFADMGYQAWFSGQKTYNGVAVLSRLEASQVLKELPGVDPAQKRFLAVTVGNTRVINVYVPNGASVGSDKYGFKLEWLKALESYVAQELKTGQPLIVTGDFNIAPDDRDVHDPAFWAGGILVSPPEREGYQRLIGLPLVDCFREKEARGGHFSWWDYRAGSFPRNRGVRIDHILASQGLALTLSRCVIDATPRGWPRPSDHAPVIAEFDTGA